MRLAMIATVSTFKLECECELPFVGCLTVRFEKIKYGNNKLPIKSGRANGVEVSVLCGTGCTAVIIRRSLVREDQFTGMYRYYRMLDGTVEKAQIAMVEIESPYASGELPCLSIDTPTCDIIIGNIPEVLEAGFYVLCGATCGECRLHMGTGFS